MTEYTVLWVLAAQNALADIWLNADDPNAVTAAANRLDAVLASDPHLQGRVVHEGLRALVVSPL